MRENLFLLPLLVLFTGALCAAAGPGAAVKKGKFHVIYTGQSEGAYGPCG